MNNKVNGHTGDFIKRQAKKIKKQENITHLQALDKASINAGFNSWKHFINVNNSRIPSRDEDSSLKNLKPSFSKATQLINQKAFNPFRNLLVSSVDTLLDKGLIDLDGKSEDNEGGHAFVDLFGYSSVVIWRSISYDELEISVWWKYNHKSHPQVNLSGNARETFTSTTPLANKSEYKNFVGVVVSGWLERRDGKYLMGDGSKGILKHYTRRGENKELEKMPLQKPKRFDSKGKFYR